MIDEPAPEFKELVGKLAFEVGRLRREVSILHKRIRPFAQEGAPPNVWAVEEPKSVLEAFKMIGSVRSIIESCQLEISAIREQIDAIDKDAFSTHQLKGFLSD